MRLNPDFSLFNNSESLLFFTELVELCNNNKPKELNIVEPLGHLHLNVAEINLSFQQDKKRDISELLTTYDQRRDAAILCLRNTAMAYTYHFIAKKRSAGTLVLNSINKYGSSIQQYNYQAQTSTIKNLLNDLESKDVAGAIEVLGMIDVVKEIAESNQLFGDTYIECIREAVASEQIAAAKLLQNSIKNYRRLIEYIQVNNRLEPKKEIAQLLRRISDLVMKYNSLINTRLLTNSAQVHKSDAHTKT